jgi:hypothetical protein
LIARTQALQLAPHVAAWLRAWTLRRSRSHRGHLQCRSQADGRGQAVFIGRFVFNKHLEQIYAKLAVENRSAAAMIARRIPIDC